MSPSTFLRLGLILISLWLLIRLWPVILVLVVALFILGTLSPAVSWLERRGARRGVGIALVFAGVFALAEKLTRYHVSAPLADWLQNLTYGVHGNTVVATAFAYSLRLFQSTAYGLSALFLALYMMIDRDRLRGGLFALIPRTHHIRLTRVMLNLETIVGAYIRGQLITGLLIGAFTFMLLTACGVENAMALAMFAAIGGRAALHRCHPLDRARGHRGPGA